MVNSLDSSAPRWVGRFLAGAAALALVTSASAQTATATQGASATAGADQELQEIIVTANKIKEPVQKVAQTINVVSAKTLDELHVQNLQELQNVVGGLSLTETSPSEQSISLRGIKMPSAGGAGGTTNTVESYLNDAPISTIDTFTTNLDIAQVEVLRGPQGTLRGRPSPSGAITLVSQKGSFVKTEGYVEVTGSNHNGKNVQAAVGGPINDQFAFRIAGVYDDNDGTGVKDIYNGHHNYSKTYAGRATLTWKPSDKVEFNLMQQATHTDGDFYRQVEGTPPCSVADGGTYPFSSVGCGLTLTLDQKIALNEGQNPNSYRGYLTILNGRVQLTDTIEADYVGSYANTDYFTQLDFDFAGVGGVNEFSPLLNARNKNNVMTNEFRLQSSGNSFYNFTYGVFTSKNRLESHLHFPFNPPGSFTLEVDTPSVTKDLGLFTNQRFHVTDKDDIAVGARYSTIQIDSLNAGTTRLYSATTGNASYQHQFTQDLMAYVSYGTSFRPGSGGALGSPNGGAGIPVSFGNFNDEHSNSWEYGVKSQWLDRRLTANLSYFDQKYKGYIASQFNIACTGVPNTTTGTSGTAAMAYATADGSPTGNTCFGTMFRNADAVSKGFEFEVRAQVTPDWLIGVNYTYTDAHFANALVPCNDYNGDGIPDVNGIARVQHGKYVSECKSSTTLGSLPKVAISGMTSYDLHLGGLDEYISANGIKRDESYFPQTARWFPGYTQVNATLGVKSPTSHWDVNIWAKNLFNKVVQDTDGGPWGTPAGGPSGVRIGTVINDREVGATLRWEF
jgi:iron complex outermembrane receptor protein